MSKGQKNYSLLIICIIMIVLNSEANVMAPTLSVIEKEFGVNDTMIGLMAGLFTLIGAIVSLFWGYFADKASRKFLFLLAILIGEIPCALTALAPDWPTFFALRILAGIGLGAAFPLVFAIVGDMFGEKERPWAAGMVSVAMAVGTIVGTLIGGYVGADGNWRLPFIIASVPNFLFVAIYWFFTPESKAAASEEATASLVASGLVYPKKISLADFADLFKTKTNLYLLLQGIAGTIPWGAFFFINSFLEKNKGLSIADATTVFLVFGVGMVVGNVLAGPIGGWLYKRDPRLMPLFCAVTTLLGSFGVIYVVLWAPANLALLSGLGFAAACMAALTGPNTKTMLLDTNAPEHRGAIFSIFNITDSLGTGIGKFVAGILSGAFGLGISLAACSAMCLFCSVLMVMSATVFVGDIAALRARMKGVAEEMRLANPVS